MRILIAEDNEDSRILLVSFLQANGYKIDSAENGKKALELAHQNKPDLVISDILMPEMDGYSLCRAFKNDEQLQTVPIIFYTATYTDPSDEKFAMNLGASKFIIKPMDMEDLLLEIKGVIEQHKVKKLTTPKQPLTSPNEIEKEYSEVLTKKLDKKNQELKQERQKLDIEEHRYQRLVETLHEKYFFYIHDTDGIMNYVSPSVQNVIGYTQEEFKTHYLHYLTDSPINKEAKRQTELAIKGERQPTYEIDIFHKDGSPHRLEVTEEPIFNKDGEVISIEGIAHDITERLRVETERCELEQLLQQSQKMEAIGTLAGGIAHDFNNILTPIIGYSEIVFNNLDDKTNNKGFLQEVLNAAYRAKSLTKQILTFSRHNEEELQIIQPQPIIKEALKLLRSSIPSTITIKHEIDPECGLVLANQTKIHQLLMNLCTNAYHAMRGSGGTITVTLDEKRVESADYRSNLKLAPGNYVRLTVNDTGCGIDKKNQGRIFEPYFTTKPKDQGTGLGLAVVHGIVKSHGGHITLYSEKGVGTTFHVYLPRAKSFSASAENAVTEAPLGGNERVMVVDDEEVNVQVLDRMLDILGYQTALFNSPSEALNAFKKAPYEFDLIITDMTMPVMTGAEMAIKMLKIRPNTPVILCSGFSEIINADKAYALGIKEYIMKPILRTDLAKSIRKALKGSA